MAVQTPQANEDLWPVPIDLLLLLAISAAVYFRGFRRIRATRPDLFPIWRLYCFLGGLAAVWIALASPLDALNESLLSVHMAQHMVLMLVVPPLLLLGAPAVPLLRGLPQVWVRVALGPFFRSKLLRNLLRLLTKPVVAWLVAMITFVGWHMPPAYELALRVPAWHEAEHASFLVTSLLFWFPVIEPWPSASQGSRWWMAPYLLTADLVNTALAAWLTFSRKLVYPIYGDHARAFGIAPLNDQAAAGALMWVVGSIFYLAPLIWITMDLLSPADRHLLKASK